MATRTCPLRGQKAELKDASAEIALICYHDSCSIFKIVTTDRAFVETLNTDQRNKLSAFNCRITANKGVATLSQGSGERFLQGYGFAAKAASRFGLNQCRIEYNSGSEDANLNFFVHADEGRYTLRVYSPEMTRDKLRSILL